ncbi:MAG: HAMP domain-containing histidine kinase [Candidatus Kerfeldbacteria bacterium]|nr:HAMP domain-containing histidine kinase [Candidatus Kerfeldbacteria bacterium]
MIVVPFYSFSLNFPKPLSKDRQKRLSIILWIYSLTWGVIIGIPGVTLKDVVYDPTGRLVTGPGLYFYGLSIAIFLLGGLFHLWRKKRQADAVERRQINLIFFGISFSSIFGIACNLVLPLFNNYDLVWLGPDFTLVLVVFMAYAIVKHHLFEIRLVATELFAALLGMVFIVQVLQSTSTFELGVRMIVLLVYGFISWQLVKSVYEEIRAKTALQELLQMKTDFLHMASHQLRTPLTAIRGMLTMLYEGDYDRDPIEKQKAVQKNVLVSVERLNNVVNDLLQSAELEKGMTGELKPGKIEPLVEQCIQTLQPNFNDKSVQLLYRSPSQGLPDIMMRADYLQQVFLNLIDNAEHYTPAGGQVEVKLYQQNQEVIFETHDTGIGIEPAELAKIFDRFYRTDHAKSMRPHGTGLGLFIVQQIITQHGGSIAAHSDGKNKGAIFTVRLPIS